MKLKKIVLTNLPYVFIAVFATKLGQTWRYADGADLSDKILHGKSEPPEEKTSVIDKLRAPLTKTEPSDRKPGRSEISL